MKERKSDRSADALRRRLCAPTLTDDRVRALYREWQVQARARVRREMAKLDQIVAEILAEAEGGEA